MHVVHCDEDVANKLQVIIVTFQKFAEYKKIINIFHDKRIHTVRE